MRVSRSQCVALITAQLTTYDAEDRWRFSPWAVNRASRPRAGRGRGPVKIATTQLGWLKLAHAALPPIQYDVATNRVIFVRTGYANSLVPRPLVYGYAC